MAAVEEQQQLVDREETPPSINDDEEDESTTMNVIVAGPPSPWKKRKVCVIVSAITGILLFLLVATIIVYIIVLQIQSKSNETSKNDQNDGEVLIKLSGKYPIHAGSAQNQQIGLNSIITEENIKNVEELCVHEFPNEFINSGGHKGFIVVDNNEYGYFSNESGFMNCFDLNTCEVIWSIDVKDIFDEVNTFAAANSATLYTSTNSNDNDTEIKGLLMAASQYIGATYTSVDMSCYILALDISNPEEGGKLLWKTAVIDGTTSQEALGCMIHGVMIDDDGFAYGGVSSLGNYFPAYPNNLWRGKAYKIDIRNGEIMNEFWTLPEYDLSDDGYQDRYINGFYSGASVWPILSIIDDYFVFGTGQLHNQPRRVDRCLLGNVSEVPINDTQQLYNQCGDDFSDDPNGLPLKWRCLEKDVHSNSVIILDKHNFTLLSAVPLYGVEAWGPNCQPENATLRTDEQNVVGPDADNVAVAVYHDKLHNNKPYVAVGSKTGQFYTIEIPSGDIKIVKKIGPWSEGGGTSPFSMAVDEDNLIAIYTFRGVEEFTRNYRYKLADDTTVCDSGSIHAINLTTGDTIWQWVNPFGMYGDDTCENQSALYDLYIDETIEGQCQQSFDGTKIKFANETAKNNVIIPSIDNINIIEPPNKHTRSILIAPSTISNNMVFIPTITGEVWVHDLFDGKYITHFQCPDYELEYQNITYINREAIRMGTTIYDDKIVFNCGASYLHPELRLSEEGEVLDPFIRKSQLNVYKLT